MYQFHTGTKSRRNQHLPYKTKAPTPNAKYDHYYYRLHHVHWLRQLNIPHLNILFKAMTRPSLYLNNIYLHHMLWTLNYKKYRRDNANQYSGLNQISELIRSLPKAMESNRIVTL